MPTGFFQQYQIKAEPPPAVIIEELNQKIESRWHQPWSEPVRFRRLATAYQQQPVWSGQLPPRIFEGSWHYAWSEPVRQKIGLAARLQRTFTRPDELPLIPDVTGVIAARETGTDTAELFVWAYNTEEIPIDLTAVNVSIKEVDANDASTSVGEID